MSKENIADAIAEFETTLITPDSKFDKFLRGDESALNAQEKRGYETFKEVGCTACHNGPYLGGNSYQTLGYDYFKDRGGKMEEGDLGRYNVTKKDEDKHMFKVPMLRNIELTAPYFHDGRVATLPDAVRKMAKYQLGTDLNGKQTADIVAFLKTLTGEYKGVPLNQVKAPQTK